MNNRKKTVIPLVLLLFYVILFTSGAKAQSVINVVGDHAPPFRIFEKDGVSGIYFDAMKEIGRRLDVVVQFHEQPFKRALFSIKTGSADVICGLTYNDNRGRYMAYTKAELLPATKAFYVHPDAPIIRNYNDLELKQIATLRGSVYFDKFDNDQRLRKEPVGSYEQALKKVWYQRDDVVIIPEQEGDYLVKQLGLQLKKCPFLVEGRRTYIAISKKSSVLQLQHGIEEAMEQIIQDGTMEKILDRYR